MVRKMVLPILLVLTLMIPAGLFAGGAAEPDVDAPVELKLGHLAAEAHPLHAATVHLKEYVEEATDGMVRIELFPASVLGGQSEMLEQTVIGSLEMVTIGAGPAAEYVPEFNAFALPFAFDDWRHYYRVMDDAEVEQHLSAESARSGLQYINNWDWGPRVVTNSVREIRTPGDMRGMKIRVPDEIDKVLLFSEVGADPTPIPFPELYSSLQTGVVDAQENPVSTVYHQGLFEVQDYVTITNHVLGHTTLFVNQDVWDSLTAQAQQAITEGANQARGLMRELMQEEYDEALEGLRNEGMQVTELSADELQAWRDAGSRVWPQMYDVAGGREYVEWFLSRVEATR